MNFLSNFNSIKERAKANYVKQGINGIDTERYISEATEMAMDDAWHEMLFGAGDDA